MAEIQITKQSIVFVDDEGKHHSFKKGAKSHSIQDKYLGHWFIEAHKKSGNLVVLAKSDSPPDVEMPLPDSPPLDPVEREILFRDFTSIKGN